MIASLRTLSLAMGFCSGGLAAFGQRGEVGQERPGAVPEAAAKAGLTPADWAEIQDAYEHGRRAAGTVEKEDAQPVDPGSSHATTSGPILQQQAFLKGHNTDIGDFLGWSVSASGDTVVVGAFAQDSPGYDAGAAYVFVRNGTSWTQQAYLKASNAGIVDYFGTSVSLDGDTVVVGAPWEASSSTGVNGPQSNDLARAGAAYVFVRSGTTWSQQAYLKASNTDRDDWFGMGVSVSGDTVVVGAPREDSTATGVNGDPSNDGATDAGAAYVFVRSGTSWSQQAYLKASNTQAGDLFGGDGDLFYGYFRGSVEVSGDTIVVGAYGEDSNANVINGNQNDNSAMFAGAAYVFVRNGTSWSQQAYLKASNSIASDLFGQSVSVSHDTVSVGARSGAYVFTRSGTTWSQQERLALEAFSVSVSGDTLMVGRPHDNGFAGAAYLFVRLGTTWIQQDIVSHGSI